MSEFLKLAKPTNDIGRRPFACFVLLILPVLGAAGVELPAAPAWSVVTPFSLIGEGSQPISYNGVIFRIQMGTPIGALYRVGSNKPLNELRWDKTAGITREFNVAVNDRLRQFGYGVVDPTDVAFENTKAMKARFQLGGLVTRVKTDYFMKREGYSVSAESYGVASLDLEVQLQDTDSQQLVFRKHYQGYGVEQGKSPQPLFPAFINAIDHALADPEFVKLLRRGDAENRNNSGNMPLLTIASCVPFGDTHLPGSIATLRAAVVGLRAGTVTGSGVIVSPEGHVLTAAHLVDGRETVVVTLMGGMELDARVLRMDSQKDVAVLQLPGRRHQCAPLAKQIAAVGADLFAVGTPLDPEFANSITRGIVSGHREIDGTRLLQTDASVNAGNSGGPMFDSEGRIQAIVSFKAYGAGVEGIAFGVPVDVVTRQLALATN